MRGATAAMRPSSISTSPGVRVPRSGSIVMTMAPRTRVLRLIDLTSGEPGDDQGEQDDPAERGRDPERLDRRERQDVADDAQQQDAAEGADHGPPPAVQADAPDHG